MNKHKTEIYDRESRKAHSFPAASRFDSIESGQKMRVAVYMRCASYDAQPLSSFEAQEKYYTELIQSRPGWEIVEIYKDEGVSGTSVENRPAFKRMLDDCETGKIDLILTKSISRFSRNIVDGLNCIRRLSDMQPPIGVFFESENIYTLKAKSELLIPLISQLAREESDHAHGRVCDE